MSLSQAPQAHLVVGGYKTKPGITLLPTFQYPDSQVLELYKVQHSQLAKSSLADSPEGGMEEDAELEGLVTVPGSEADIQIKDIPIVTALDCETDESMLYTKPMSPGIVSQDYYTTTYLNSTCSSPDTSSMDTSAACPPSTRDFDHMYASLSRVDTSALLAQNVHLREMLVNHLDLIQQQSETIVSKDRQLKSLREENSLLLQKLARMERRIRPEQGPWESEGTKRTSEKGEPDRPVKRQKVGAPRATPGRGQGGGESDPRSGARAPTVVPLRDSGYEAECPADQLTDEFVGESEETVPEEQLTPVPGVPPAPLEDEKEDKVQSRSRKEEKGKKESRGASRSPAVTQAINRRRSRPPGPPLPGGSPVPPPPPLLTGQTFYVGCTNDKLVCLDDQLTEVPSLQRGVEVPSWREDKTHYTLLVQNKLSLKKSKETPTWRIKSTNPAYTMEGTENIEDSTFLKRHERHEKEEKQRKRWDLQRLREQQQLQKLRARQEKQHAAQASRKPVELEMASLLPALEAATSICVDEKVPVTAFGRPLPDMPPTHFSLDWLEQQQH